MNVCSPTIYLIKTYDFIDVISLIFIDINIIIQIKTIYIDIFCTLLKLGIFPTNIQDNGYEMVQII